MERDKEYDAFGPWIYEIDEEHEVPSIFRNYYNEHDKPLILFKVPRNIERRSASPNMDLYDYLIGAYDTYLHVLKRNGKNAIEKKIDYSNILTIKDIHALLWGELIFFTDNEPIIIYYNTVSEDIILKLINIIGQKTSIVKENSQLESIPIEYNPNKDDSLDFLFVNLSNELRQINPDISLVAYQPRIYLQRASSELFKKLKHHIFSKTAFITTNKELIILEREVPKRIKGKEGYSYSYLYLPFKNIAKVIINNIDRGFPKNQRAFWDDNYEQPLSSIELIAGNQSFTYIFENKNRRIFDLYYCLKEILQLDY